MFVNIGLAGIVHPSVWLERVLIRDRDHVPVVAVGTIEFVQAQSDCMAIHAQGRDHLKTQRISDA